MRGKNLLELTVQILPVSLIGVYYGWLIFILGVMWSKMSVFSQLAV